MNNWKTIWEKRTGDESILHSPDKKKVFLELKRLSGLDVFGDVITYESFIMQYKHICGMLFNTENPDPEKFSAYEVGCGSGANLYLLENDGYNAGGLDFSSALIDYAKTVCKSSDITCSEANELPTEPHYYSVFSSGVFSYFESFEYATAVLEKMYEKAIYSIGIINIHDIEKKEDYITFRKKEIEDFENKYKGLDKLFYPKEFFSDFAEKHGLKIKFDDYKTKGYWNDDFVYHCYMYRNI